MELHPLLISNTNGQSFQRQVPVAARSKAYVCGRSPAEIWVRIPPGAWMFVCCECRVLSGRGLCDELITRPEKSYRLWCVVVCDLETSRMRSPWPALGRSTTKIKPNCVIWFAFYYLLSSWPVFILPLFRDKRTNSNKSENLLASVYNTNILREVWQLMSKFVSTTSRFFYRCPAHRRYHVISRQMDDSSAMELFAVQR